MLIRQAAFETPTCKKFLKGALHCHTTRSDGKGKPDEVIRLHKQNGYDFMALTDHNIYNNINYAPDVDMTMLGGMERDVGFQNACENGRPMCIHIVGVGKPDTGYAQDERLSHYKTIVSSGDAQGMIDELHAHHNLTVYCHPEWSGTTAKDFDMLRGNFAMEIWNTGCAIENGLDTNAAYWDELLDEGQHIWGVATDDGHMMDQHCKGWVMVNSENDADSILTALEAGRFYASCGPEIRDFYVEDFKVHILCSPVSRITFRSLRFPLQEFTQDEAGLTEAVIDIPKNVPYTRVTVQDAQGRRAWTNPIFLK